jgi:uncharacterized protein involved in exopolysaccharide biosynthesis
MEVQDYIQIFSKRKWLIIGTYISIFFVAGLYTVWKPKQYQSTTTIMTLPPQVSEDFVRSTVTLGSVDRLSTIQEQITSRTRLKKVMEEVGLFADARKEGLEDEAASAMVRRITIDIAQDPRRGSRPESEAFSISFLHEDPMLAMLTTSRIASLFIEENLRLREKQAVGTSEFLETQLRETKAKLEAQEGKVKRYKMKYSGGLPEELRVNLNNMDRLQRQERTVFDEIRFAGQRKATLQTQLSMLTRGPKSIIHDDGRVEVDTSEVRGEVEELEKKLAAMPMSHRSSKDKEENVPDSRTYLPLTGGGRDEHRSLKAQIKSTEAEIVALKRERKTIRRNIVALQARLDQGPRRDQELMTLTRDYDNLKDQYNELQKKKMEADISQDLEVRLKGAQFQILDPANLPKEPFSPDIKKIFALAFLMAGFLGFGGVIGLEKMDLSLRGVTDFKHFFDIPILASIPILETMEIDRRQNSRRKAIIAGVVSFAFAFFAFLLFLLKY